MVLSGAVISRSCKGLKRVPEGVMDNTKLKELYLNRNKLEPLPETIGDLTLLERLYLSANKLTSLPETIGNLALLEIALSLR